MPRLSRLFSTLAIAGASTLVFATSTMAALPLGTLQQRGGGPGRDSTANGDDPKPYSEVITDEAVTQSGYFAVHRVGEDIFFEIPSSMLNTEMLLIQKQVESTLQDAGSFFGGGARLYVQWERDGNHVVMRQKEYDLTAAESDAIWGHPCRDRTHPRFPMTNRYENEPEPLRSEDV